MTDSREAFDRWFGGSKYAQVILPTTSDRQIAYDGWQAAIAHIRADYTICEKEPFFHSRIGNYSGPLYKEAAK